MDVGLGLDVGLDENESNVPEYKIAAKIITKTIELNPKINFGFFKLKLELREERG